MYDTKYKTLNKPRVLKLIGLYWSAQAIYPYILIPKEAFENGRNRDVLIHEETHLNRMREEGVVKWYLKYVFLRKFRFEEEVAATKAQIDFLKQEGLKIDYDKFAKILSSWTYLRMASYKEAKEQLQQ